MPINESQDLADTPQTLDSAGTQRVGLDNAKWIKVYDIPLFLSMNANDKDSIVDPRGNVNNTI